LRSQEHIEILTLEHELNFEFAICDLTFLNRAEDVVRRCMFKDWENQFLFCQWV